MSEKTSKAPNAAVCFQWADKPRTGIEVLDVIGVGPFKAEDDEGRILFRIDMVNPSSKGGYAGASLLLVDSDTNDFYKGEEDSVIVSGSKAKSGVTKDTLPQNLLLGEKQARLFASLYDEHEYRVYIRGKHNLFFRPTDIKNIVLPSTLVISAVRSDIFDLHAFCEDVDGGELADFPSDPKEFSRLALDREYVQSRKKEEEKKELAIGIYPVIRLLFELLTGKYRDVNVEFIGSPSSRSISLRTKVYSKKSNEHQRILVEASKLVPDLKDERTAKLRWHDGDTVVAPLKWIGAGDCPADLQGMDGALARIGAEVIVIGYDKAGKKYVLFVDNAHKATAFYELPGGGLPSPSASFE